MFANRIRLGEITITPFTEIAAVSTTNLCHERKKSLLLEKKTFSGCLGKGSGHVNPEGDRQIMERGSDLYEIKWIMLLKDRLNNIHFKLRTKLNLQKTSGSDCWNSNNYRTVSCTSFLNLTCQIRNVYNWNKKQFQNSNLLCLNQLLSCCRKARLHIIKKQ